MEPEKCFVAIATALRDLSEQAASHDVIIGLENEHACNIATATESARALAAVDHPNLKLVWDPANSLVAGENPFPEGYAILPKDRIAHVHAKDGYGVTTHRFEKPGDYLVRVEHTGARGVKAIAHLHVSVEAAE